MPFTAFSGTWRPIRVQWRIVFYGAQAKQSGSLGRVLEASYKGTGNDRQGRRVYRPPGYGAHHPDPALQSLLRLLQRVRRLLQASLHRHDAPPYRPAGSAWDHDYHAQRWRTSAAPGP